MAKVGSAGQRKFAMAINDTSGQGHPYWYEWFVGLIEVIDLLDPNSDVEAVAFQVSSIKVWDDVVVKLKNGRRCYQVKHSRVGDSLAFGDLVQSDDKGKTLLGELFKGCHESGLEDDSTTLILYTNRNDGTKWASLSNGTRRPPLLKFWSWMKLAIDGASSFSEVSVPDEYKGGWEEWIGCLSSEDDASAIAFLSQLQIRTKEDDLDGLEGRIREGLATAFGISPEKAAPLFDALTRALTKWTTGHPGVTVEDLCTALTVPPEPKELAHAPPPPHPFFPTRSPVAADLELALQNQEEAPVVFLTGEPGSGKTSVVSWLANRRTVSAFQGPIGIRFFCFEPIRPEQPFISPDSSRVQPEELWFSLLAQLRRGLEGRLRELNVPLRNAFLTWQEARAHVIRLADSLGREVGRRFVISIDGIDHAARAAQVLPEKIANFFASLPTPDELDGKAVRLLIAGQPPEHYTSQYPSWLQGTHSKVRRFDLGRLAERLIGLVAEDQKSALREKLTRFSSPAVFNGPDEDESEAQGKDPSSSIDVRVRDEGDFWSEIDTAVAKSLSEDRPWVLHEKLIEIALDRAILHGNEVLLDGLDSHIQMHARWAFGGGELNEIAWKELPNADAKATWEWIAVQFQRVLLESYSADVIDAALRGMHALVECNPSVISQLFASTESPWSRTWLLNAAESWAVLHPDGVLRLRDTLSNAMSNGDLVSRLQAWVVLSRNCDALGQDAIPFPLPAEPKLDVSQVSETVTALLEVPPEKHGRAVFANRYSATQSMLTYLEHFGFNFSKLEGLIADGLYQLQELRDPDLKTRGPHRYADFFCTPMDAEKAVGDAVLQIICSDWCSQDVVAALAQGFLGNEDSWIYRTPPQPLKSSNEWPSEREYGGTEIDSQTRRDRILRAATSASITAGWRVFSAHVVDYTWKEDFVLDYWHEEPQNSLVIQKRVKPTCPGGRSFAWWIGEPFELERERFVSGLFVGGRTRLSHCHFEIRPPKAWRDSFGWQPNPRNPLEWAFEGQPIARYERLHGQLRDNTHGPNYRQPLIDRWIVTEDAFEQLQSKLGRLVPKQEFEAFPFKE
jgi:hypothetical protein